MENNESDRVKLDGEFAAQPVQFNRGPFIPFLLFFPLIVFFVTEKKNEGRDFKKMNVI